MTRSISTTSLAAIAGALLLGAATPAFAQDGEELVVTGRYGKVPDSVQSLSQTVSYADLDLSTKGGRAEFRHRLKLTARYLCEKLGESSTSTPIAPSCQDAAVSDALKRAGTIEESFAPRGTAWVAAPRWHAPYPDDWYSRYPD
ncbi:UrcA family protein [Sphingomonas histidinilytica]|jgi:UrcA family protein|uniref:UrcA family protein n=1 Tax=Rhizorhabdus histidinilytica TaxID=439228 RepID=A0A1T5CLH3_9SPHN|nr:UrcA family protein [Rhizorhabdus histidinilytica]MBO9380552.1 UrcA family protein [Rhizorhabdus histidinilytica]QEH78926.1 UrcA family protein [Sphingomonas sp. C8-2]SKB60338.1 UrcA family protein [Rhizorhabdus histidinilytica]